MLRTRQQTNRVVHQRVSDVEGGGDPQALTLAVFERNAVIVACAISAGIHAALTPEHLAEGTGPGLGFFGATVLLGGSVAVLTRRPASVAALAGTGVVLAGLLASYTFATTTGLFLVHPVGEPIEGLALITKAIEAIGLAAAAHLLWRGRSALAPALPLRKER
jgi:hypothetical protein